jgi:energy-coupling factor transport system permease protein
MMEGPRYLAGDSFLGRRDPRVLILVPALTVVTVAQIHDLRLMVAAVVVAVGYYASARIPFDAVRANWAFVGVFVGLLAGVNGLIVGAQQHGDTAGHLFSFPVIDIAVSTASLSYMITMLLRFLAIARRLRQLQPLVVPVTVGAFVDAEDVADALDLRGFGPQRRTSVRTLRFDGSDHIIVGLFLTVAVAATAASLSGHTPGLWVW